MHYQPAAALVTAVEPPGNQAAGTMKVACSSLHSFGLTELRLQVKRVAEKPGTLIEGLLLQQGSPVCGIACCNYCHSGVIKLSLCSVYNHR